MAVRASATRCLIICATEESVVGTRISRAYVATSANQIQVFASRGIIET